MCMCVSACALVYVMAFLVRGCSVFVTECMCVLCVLCACACMCVFVDVAGVVCEMCVLGPLTSKSVGLNMSLALPVERSMDPCGFRFSCVRSTHKNMNNTRTKNFSK